ncbi:FOXM [Mytilus coruscus]|uniref:FOXM n=1 Tax=Mytilus coruscus TaxID=42192 RepID=A0A6J8AW70_MYTCO|nr:FOXM [Mytilus coruscus]
MSSNHGRHLVGPHFPQATAKKTVYPLPQQLAEKVIKDRGRNAYVVVFDTNETVDSSSGLSNSDRNSVLKTSSRILNETNIKQENDSSSFQKLLRSKSTSTEDVKINFSNLEFEEYDSSKTAVKVFSDDDIDIEIDKCTVKQEIDEGYEETHRTRTSEPIAGYMVIPPSFSTPLSSKFNLSGSSGYFSGGSSGIYSQFNTPSPLPTPEQGFQHPAARQIILVPSSVSLEGRNVVPQYSNISPMSSLAAGLHNSARIQSPTVFSTKKFTGADAFSLPENPQEKFVNLEHDESNRPLSSTSLESTSRSSTPFQWEQVENRIVIQAPNKKPLDLSLPNVNKTAAEAQQSINEVLKEMQKTKTQTSKIGEVVIHCDVKQKETVVMVQQGDSSNYTIGHLPMSDSQESINPRSSEMLPPCIKQETDDIYSHDSGGFVKSPESFGFTNSQESNDSSAVPMEKEVLDTSLTNIQWLGGIQLKNPTKADKPDPSKSMHSTTPVQWKRMSTDDILRIAAECGRKKRPPFSYMTLIQMALHSKEDKRMRLRDICAWIESTFPYYKYTAKPGWRNSIRHNLSLYSIFERETNKKHGSYWTVRDDCPEKLKSCPVRDTKKDEVKSDSPLPFNGMIPVIPSYIPQSTASTTCTGTQARKRAGPQPILPRPSPLGNGPLQTYALIPIQNVPNSTAQNQNLPLTSSQESTSSENSQSDSKKGNKTRKIAPKLSPSLLLSPPNIVKQAWLDSQALSSSEAEGQGESNKSDNETCAKRARTGLPQPKLYSKDSQPVRRTRSRRKQKLVPKERELMQDSSDEETEYAKFVSRLEEELPTPMRKLLDENVEKCDESSAITSTPLKNSGFLPQMPSPFSGLTPLKNENILDNSFLECLRGSPQMTTKKSPSSSSSSSPKLDLNFIGLTPIKISNHDNSYNLSKFLAEYPIDANMVDEADVLPVDLSALNWSSVQNMLPLDNS